MTVKNLLAFGVLAGMTFAQVAQQQPNPPASQSQQPTPSQQATQQESRQPSPDQSGPDTKSTGLRTQKYSGTLVDAQCAGGASSSSPSASSSPSTSSSPSPGQASPTPQTSSTPEGARAGGSSDSCSVTSNTKEFALKLEDGRVLRLDSVGNLRAAEAMQQKKNWSENASSGKPIRASIYGSVEGEKLLAIEVR